MAISTKGSNTEKNVAFAFANESMTVNRYLIFSRIAMEEGLNRARDTFAAISEDEKKHAATLFKFFEGGTVDLNLKFPVVPAGSTRVNIENSLAAENAAWNVRYPEFAETAREEGFPEIAEAFESFARDERAHQEEFEALQRSL